MANVIVQDGNGDNYVLTECECDNTHEQNGTVCRYCWEVLGCYWQENAYGSVTLGFEMNADKRKLLNQGVCMNKG